MYENIAYEEIKSLPEDQKAEAWKELHDLYPSNKELSLKLGVAQIAVTNAVKKYVLGEPIGRANKKEKPEASELVQDNPQIDKQESQQEQQELKPKRKYNRKVKQDTIIEPKNVIESPDFRIIVNSFLININNTFSGEDAQVILNGVGGTLLKGHKYNLEIKISEAQ